MQCYRSLNNLATVAWANIQRRHWISAFVVFNTFSAGDISFALIFISLFTIAIISCLIIFTNGKLMTMVPSSFTFVDIVTSKGSLVCRCFVTVLANTFVRGYSINTFSIGRTNICTSDAFINIHALISITSISKITFTSIIANFINAMSIVITNMLTCQSFEYFQIKYSRSGPDPGPSGTRNRNSAYQTFILIDAKTFGIVCITFFAKTVEATIIINTVC